MKIGFVIGTLNYSGAEKIARLLIEALHKKYGHEIGLIIISGEGPYPEFPYVKQFPIITEGNKYLQVYKRQKRIREIVTNEQYDVVISFGVKFNLDTMEALKGMNAKVILCERNDPVSDPHRKILRLIRQIHLLLVLLSNSCSVFSISITASCFSNLLSLNVGAYVNTLTSCGICNSSLIFATFSISGLINLSFLGIPNLGQYRTEKSARYRQV